MNEEARSATKGRLSEPERADRGSAVDVRWHRMDGYYRDDDGNEIVGSGSEWMLLTGESIVGPFPRLADAKRYVEENDD